MKFYCLNQECRKEIVTHEDGISYFDTDRCVRCAAIKAAYSFEEMILALAL